jgi:hypothetical protein
MSPSKRAKPKRRRRRPGAGPRPSPGDTPEVETTGLLVERLSHPETSPALSGGDLDADWTRAQSSGEEAVGGSVTTPDQDVVDELGRALGVEQAADAEVRTSAEILEARDRDYWHLERRAADQDAGA